MKETLHFFRGFLKDPLSVGSLVPSSPALSHEMINADEFRRARMVVEVGTGTGAVTKVILGDLPAGANYLGIDLDEHFIENLKRAYPEQRFLAESVEYLSKSLTEQNLPRADFIVSGLPWTLFRAELQKKLLDAIVESLAPGGVMTTFVYLHILPTPLAQRFISSLESRFKKVEKVAVVYWNIPPAAVFRCWK